MGVNINSIKRNLIERYPFFGSIVDSLDYVETRNCINTNGLPTAGTNGNTIYYHPDFIGKLNESEQTFVFAHEVCHVAFDHLNRGKNKNPEIWNYATDAVINAFLKNDGLEPVENIVDIPWAIKYDAEQVYEKLLKRKDRKNKNQKQDKSNNSNKKDIGHDTHSFWDEERIDKANDKIIKEVQSELCKMGEKKVLKKENSKEILGKIKGALEDLKKGGKDSNSKAVGYGTETLEETVNFEDIGSAKPLINWPLILKRTNEVVELDWSYKNASIEDGVVTSNLEETSYLLSYKTEILLDTSGSIDDELLRNFLRECKNILNFSEIKVGCFDTKFYGFTEIKSIKDIDNFTFTGRGGTSFNVAVNAFSKDVDNKIIFTDGVAPMPYTRIDAIWVVFGDNVIYPMGGKVIYVDKDKLKENQANLLTKK